MASYQWRNWCGDLFGKWPELAVTLGIFFFIMDLCCCYHPSPPTCPLISATPDIIVMPVKASQNQAGKNISDNEASLTETKNIFDFQCKPHASTYSKKNFGELMLKNYCEALNYILVKLCIVKIVIGRLPHVKKMTMWWIWWFLVITDIKIPLMIFCVGNAHDTHIIAIRNIDILAPWVVNVFANCIVMQPIFCSRAFKKLAKKFG